MKYGWPLNAYDTAVNTQVPPNQQGARDHPDEIRTYLQKELQQGAIIGPFLKNPFGKNATFSPLDTRPKRDTEELRIILNLSYPHGGKSVNSSINKTKYAGRDNMELRYPSIDDLAKIVRKKGRKARIFKRDLSRAYRQLFMSPESISYLGYCFEGKYYFDVVLSMGSSSAAYCCQRTTNAITYIFNQFGYEDVNYLDDLGGAEEESKAEEAYDCLGWILDTIGIKESVSKACPPAYIVVFLGILFNTIEMTLHITEDRLAEIRALLKGWQSRKYCTLKELQSLIGKLNFAASTIRAGRVFLSRAINELKSFSTKANTRKCISKGLQKDVSWWYTFMEEFNGIMILPPMNWDAPDTIMATDSCLTRCGGWIGNKVFTAQFPSWIMDNNRIYINEKEMFAFIVAIKVGLEHIRDRNVLAYCNNKTTVEIINSGAARNPFAQACLREFIYLTAKANAMIKLVFRAGVNNELADILSRWGDKGTIKRFNEINNEGRYSFAEVNVDWFTFSHGW